MKRFVVALGLTGIICLLIGIIWLIYGKITVTLNGGDSVTSTVFLEYHDLGVNVYKNDFLLDKDKYELKIESNINKDVLGTYNETYIVNYHGRNFKLNRTVKIVDDVKPEVTPSISKITRDYCTKKDKEKLEYTVTDNYDGNITDKAILEEIDDNYVIKVSDSSNNHEEFKVPIELTEKPKDIFKLKDSSSIYVVKGSKYKDSGYTYTDGCGNKIDEDIKLEGSVDTSKNGSYKVSYTNSKGDKLTRTVTVYTPSVNNGGSNKDKVIYLTFDDGPGSYTERVLNTLAKYNVKATFFVTHQFGGYVNLIKKEYEQGHSVGVHSYTHNWNIYKSVDAYVNDFNKMNEDVLKYTGNYAKIFRFPGGSSNTVSRSYSKGVVKAIASKMTSMGYQYFDWDVDSSDAAGASRSKIYSNVVNGVKRCSKCIVLMHDIKPNTVNELDNILKTLTSQGYKFGTLNTNSPTVHHTIVN